MSSIPKLTGFFKKKTEEQEGGDVEAGEATQSAAEQAPASASSPPEATADRGDSDSEGPPNLS